MRTKNTNIDYPQIERAVALAEEKYPDADKYDVGWSDSQAYVTVFHKGHGRVRSFDELSTA